MLRKTLLALTLLTALNSISQVGIGTTTPRVSLDIQSVNSGVLFPEFSLTSSTQNIDSTAAPNTGEFIYNTNSNFDNGVGFYFWSGSEWVSLSLSNSAWSYGGNDLDSSFQDNTYTGDTTGDQSNTSTFYKYEEGSNHCIS